MKSLILQNVFDSLDGRCHGERVYSISSQRKFATLTATTRSVQQLLLLLLQQLATYVIQQWIAIYGICCSHNEVLLACCMCGGSCVITTAIPGDMLIGGSPVGVALPTITQTLWCCPNVCSYLLTLLGTKMDVPGYQLMSCDGML